MTDLFYSESISSNADKIHHILQPKTSQLIEGVEPNQCLEDTLI
jgi:hypothetical protein